MGSGLEFSEEAIGELRLAVLAIDDAVEIAVVAFVETKRDMHVNGLHGVLWFDLPGDRTYRLRMRIGFV